ncbi:MAG: TetR/AcrR family transcriptional regulator [Oscillibacter sp.]|jgi:AcrR family transcriptional regulator|nr:TetR/AcrR family transcriptional regulator [Oscillibacter sp.]
MKRERKNVLSRQRILDAAMEEFSRSTYNAVSMNTICAENNISKGNLYHYYKDKDELYLLCVEKCFDTITDYLNETEKELTGTAEQKLGSYFDARLHFFAENQIYLGIFTSAAFSPPENLVAEISKRRNKFDTLNISVLTRLLQSEPLRGGLSIEAVVRDFGMYMDYFNLNFKSELSTQVPAEVILREHEERCHRQLNILLYGVIGK